MSELQSLKIVSLALDAALMRQTAIAGNVANAGTKNYKTLEVNFEEQLNREQIGLNTDPLNNLKPFYERKDESVALEHQMVLSVENATHYRALIKGLNHHLALMKLAVHGNNQS